MEWPIDFRIQHPDHKIESSQIPWIVPASCTCSFLIWSHSAAVPVWADQGVWAVVWLRHLVGILLRHSLSSSTLLFPFCLLQVLQAGFRFGGSVLPSRERASP